MSVSNLNHITTSEKRFIAAAESGIDLDPPKDHKDNTEQVADDARRNHSVSPNRISSSQTSLNEANQYIAKLEERLKTALDNNDFLRLKNQELFEKFSFFERNLRAEKAERMEVEEALKKEKEERLVLEQRLKTEEEERKKEIVIRKEAQEKLTESEKNLKKAENMLQSKEEILRTEIAMSRKENIKRKQEKQKSEKELKDMFRENGRLRDLFNKSQRELEEVNRKTKILRSIDKARELHVQQYQEERNEDLLKISDLLYDLKKKTASCLDRFRREPSGKHRRLNDCIMAVNKRMSCCP